MIKRLTTREVQLFMNKKTEIKIITSFLAICLLFTFQVNGQITLSTKSKKNGVWNKEDKEWKIVSKKDEMYSFFEFNKEFTWFQHTTKKSRTAFLIKSIQTFEEEQKYRMKVISDVGNKYEVVLDLKNKNLKFLHPPDSTTQLTQYSIKEVWKAN